MQGPPKDIILGSLLSLSPARPDFHSGRYWIIPNSIQACCCFSCLKGKTQPLGSSSVVGSRCVSLLIFAQNSGQELSSLVFSGSSPPPASEHIPWGVGVGGDPTPSCSRRALVPVADDLRHSSVVWFSVPSLLTHQSSDYILHFCGGFQDIPGHAFLVFSAGFFPFPSPLRGGMPQGSSTSTLCLWLLSPRNTI